MYNSNSENYFEKIKYILLAIFITSTILLITFVVSGFAPFGDKSILRVDLYHQYAPFHEELRQKVLTGDSLLYSWEGGLGKDFLAQMAYYTFSPLSFLILFFPSNYLPEAILLFVFLKIVACSAFFGIYLKNTFKVNDISIAIFSVMYAFIAYITSFYWNIMWLDSIALFPLVALGLEKLIKSGKYKIYIISLTLSILVNFYIAFLVCIFATLYFLVRLFSEYSLKNDFKIILDRTIKFGILSLISGGLTMALAIPTITAISRTATSEASFPKFEIYHNIYQIITNHFSGARPIVLARNEDLPNIYSGVLTIVLLPAYFINKDIKLKEKILFGILILFMLLCAVLKPLDFLIHGAHFPANLPHRYTFIYSFILLILGFKAFKNIKGVNLITLSIFSVLYILIIFLTENILVSKISEIDTVLSNGDIITNIILIISYTFILAIYKKVSLNNNYINENTNKNIFIFTSIISFILLILALIGSLIFTSGTFNESGIFDLQIALNNLSEIFMPEGNINTVLIISIVVIIIFALASSVILAYCYNKKSKSLKQTIIFVILLLITSGEAMANSFNGFLYNGGTNRENYVRYIDDTKQMLDYIREIDNDENKFYRQEFRRFTTINDPSLYHYNGFSQFSSLAYGDTSKLIELLGIAATSNSYRYYDPTPLINAMFNIKYVMNKDGTMSNIDYEHIKDFNTVSLYKNPKHLSLGFMVNENIKNWKVDQDTPFLTQNEFVKTATNIANDLTIPVDIVDFSFENIEVKQDSNISTKYTYELTNKNSLNLIPKVTAKLINPKTQRLFLYVESTNSKRFKYMIGESTQDREISTGRSLIDCGIVEEGQEIKIEFTLDRKGEHEKTFRPSGSFRVFGAGFEEEVFDEVYSQLEDEMLIVNNYTSTTVEGKIVANSDGILFTSIPYDKAWKAFVDGEQVEVLKIANDGLIGINLEKGEHNIVFKYETSGLKLGIILTIISLIGLIGYIIYDKKKNTQNI